MNLSILHYKEIGHSWENSKINGVTLFRKNIILVKMFFDCPLKTLWLKLVIDSFLCFPVKERFPKRIYDLTKS